MYLIDSQILLHTNEQELKTKIEKFKEFDWIPSGDTYHLMVGDTEVVAILLLRMRS